MKLSAAAAKQARAAEEMAANVAELLERLTRVEKKLDALLGETSDDSDTALAVTDGKTAGPNKSGKNK